MNKNDNIRDLLKNAPDLGSAINLEHLFEVVCSTFRVTREQLISRLRTAQVSLARQVAMTLIYDDGLMSSTEIGEIFKRDHGTVFHAQRKIHQVAQFGTTQERALIKAVLEKIPPNFTNTQLSNGGASATQNHEKDKS